LTAWSLKEKRRNPMSKTQHNKQELSDVLNQILRTNIRWEKLSLNEITEVYNLICNPPELARRLAQSEILRRVQERIKLGEGMVIDMVKGFFNSKN